MLHYKEDIITFLLVLTTFLFFIFTPGKENIGFAVQGFILALIFFGLLPLGYHFFILKKDADAFGLSITTWKKGLVYILPVWLGGLLVTAALFFLAPAFQEAVLLPTFVENSFFSFALYELLLVPFLVALYEIFFRGFVQKSWLQKYLGGYAILAQSFLFALFLFMTGSFGWVTAPFILFSLFSGFLVWKNGSLYQSWLSQWLYLLAFDIFILFMR